MQLNSYTNAEKKGIFQAHILQKATAAIGLRPEEYELADRLPETLIERYTLGEPGVRQLEKESRKLFEKVTYHIIKLQQEGKDAPAIRVGP